jgi:hypothetical protein
MAMKTTMDIPDSVYRRLKAQSAAKGLAVREVLLQLIDQWLVNDESAPGQAVSVAEVITTQERAARLRAFLDETADLIANTTGPALGQLLQQGRDRVEPSQ